MKMRSCLRRVLLFIVLGCGVAASAQTVEIKLSANSSLAETVGYDDMIYFQLYSPTPSEPMACAEECPCSMTPEETTDCPCDTEMACGGSTPLDLSSGNELKFVWEASSNGDKFISVTGNRRTRVEFRGHVEDCQAPSFIEIQGADISFELDDAGLDASQKFTYNEDESFLTLGRCDGCAPGCEIYTRMQFESDTNEVLDMKFKSLSFAANYDPQKVVQGEQNYEWKTNSYMWIREPEGGVIELLQAPTAPADQGDNPPDDTDPESVSNETTQSPTPAPTKKSSGHSARAGFHLAVTAVLSTCVFHSV